MRTSRKDNWIAKVSKGTVIVYGEGRKQLCKQVKQDSNRQMNSQEQGAELYVWGSGGGVNASHQNGLGSILTSEIQLRQRPACMKH